MTTPRERIGENLTRVWKSEEDAESAMGFACGHNVDNVIPTWYCNRRHTAGQLCLDCPKWVPRNY